MPARDPSALGLSFDRGVPRQLVHKAAVEQVLVTDFLDLGQWEFACAGQAPRAHAYFNDTLSDSYDTLMLLESGRQAFIRAVHELVGVPRTSQFVFSELDMSVRDREILRVGAEPAMLVWQARLSDAREIRGELAAMRAAAELYVDGLHCLDIAGSGAFVNPRIYRLLRRRSLRAGPADPPPHASRVDPRSVGRRLSANVVIDAVVSQDGGCSADVVVDEQHATFFDHPLDHVPAMLLVEAMRQTALSAASQTHDLKVSEAAVIGCRVEYGRYAELDARLRCSARAGEARRTEMGIEVRVAVVLEQRGAELASGELTLAVMRP